MFRSQLNEYCQKRGVQLPEYTCEGNQQEGFLATVYLFTQDTFEGKGNNKKEAKEQAAQTAMNYLQKENIPCIDMTRPVKDLGSANVPRPQKNSDYFIYLIDLENIPIKQFPLTNPKQERAIGFVSPYHPMAQQNIPGLHKIVIPSPVREAADHAMSYFAGRIAHSFQDKDICPKFILYSRDQTAENTRRLLEGDGYQVQLFTSF